MGQSTPARTAKDGEIENRRPWPVLGRLRKLVERQIEVNWLASVDELASMRAKDLNQPSIRVV